MLRQWNKGQVLGFNLDQGYVRVASRSDQLRFIHPLGVVQACIPGDQLNCGWGNDHPDAQRAGDHVIVGDDVPVGVDNNARAQRTLSFQGGGGLLLSLVLVALGHTVARDLDLYYRLHGPLGNLIDCLVIFFQNGWALLLPMERPAIRPRTPVQDRGFFSCLGVFL